MKKFLIFLLLGTSIVFAQSDRKTKFEKIEGVSAIDQQVFVEIAVALEENQDQFTHTVSNLKNARGKSNKGVEDKYLQHVKKDAKEKISDDMTLIKRLMGFWILVFVFLLVYALFNKS